MDPRYANFAICCGSLLFLTGCISLVVLLVTRVLPLHRTSHNFEEKNCTVKDNNLSCKSGTCECSRGTNEKIVLCLKVYVCLECDKEEMANKSCCGGREKGYLLRRDVHHLSDECTFKKEISICEVGSPQNLTERYSLGSGVTTICYRNPQVLDEVILERNHSRGQCRRDVLLCVLWPVAVIGLFILILITALYLCPRRRVYRRIP